MLKKLIPISILLIFYCCSSYSQQTDSVNENTMLWKIEGNGLNTPSYMFGTFHMVCLEDIKMSDTLKNIILQSKEFYVEHDLNTVAVDSLENIHFMKGKTLEKLIGRRYFKQIKQNIKDKYLIGEDRLNMMTPFSVESLVIASSFKCRIISYETILKRFAKDHGIELNFLETFARVDTTTIHLIPLQKQISSLQWVIDNRESIVADLQADLDLYKKKALLEIYLKATVLHGSISNEARKILADDRNRNWLPIIESAMKNNSCFFAVRCAHLAGVSGLIALLLDKGYEVTPVNY